MGSKLSMSPGLRQTKFQLELVNVEELKEKRYTRVGHKAAAAQGAYPWVVGDRVAGDRLCQCFGCAACFLH